MKDEAQQPRPPYTRSPLYLLGQLDSHDPSEDVYDDVREMIVNMMRLLEEAEGEIRRDDERRDTDTTVADRIALFLRGEEEGEKADG